MVLTNLNRALAIPDRCRRFFRHLRENMWCHYWCRCRQFKCTKYNLNVFSCNNTEVILKETIIKRDRIDTTELEVRITQLTSEVYLWKKKYMDLQNKYDRQGAIEDTVIGDLYG